MHTTRTASASHGDFIKSYLLTLFRNRVYVLRPSRRAASTGDAGSKGRPAANNAARIPSATGASQLAGWSAGRRSVSVTGLRTPEIIARARLGAGLASPLEWASQTHSGKARCHRSDRKERQGVSQTPGASRRSIPFRERKRERRCPRRDKQPGRGALATFLLALGSWRHPRNDAALFVKFYPARNRCDDSIRSRVRRNRRINRAPRIAHPIWAKMPQACPHDAKLTHKHYCQGRSSISQQRDAGTSR